MAFSGDHPVVENILFDVSGSAVALVHSASIGPDLLAQPGIMVAGYHSSSGGGYQAALLQLDDKGRLMVDAQITMPSDTLSVTGSVAITGNTSANPLFVVVSGSGGTTFVTGTVGLDRGNDSALPLFVTGSVGVVGPVTISNTVTVTGSVTAAVTGTVNLDRGNDAVNPLFITGSVGISTPIVIGSGHVSASLDRGDSFGNPLFVTGSVGITNPIVISSGKISASLDHGDSFANPLFTTGSVGINGIISTREVISTVSSGTYILANTSAVTIQAANPNRRGMLIYNLSNKAMYVKFGTGAAALDFTVKIFSDDVYNVPVLYTGIITAAWVTGANLGAMVTEMTP